MKNKQHLMISQLMKALGNESSSVRESAADMLIKIGWRPSTQPEQVSYFIASYKWPELTKMGGAAVETLLTFLSDKDFYVRKYVIDILGNIGDERAVEPLIDILSGNCKTERKHTKKIKDMIENLIMLSQVKVFSDIEQYESSGHHNDDVDNETIPQNCQNEKAFVRASAAKALGRIGDIRAIDPLLLALKSKDLEIQYNAFRALCSFKYKVVDHLINALSDCDPCIRKYAARALGIINDTKAAEPLIRALADEDSSVRETVVESLGILADPISIDPLIEALKDQEPFVRENAAKALGRLGSDKAVNALIDTLKDSDSFVRTSVVKALGMIADPKATAPLIAALKDENKWVRRNAVIELKKMDNSQMIEPLIDALKDESKDVQEAALKALSEMKTIDSVKPLIEILKKGETGQVRQYAANLLKSIQVPIFSVPLKKTDNLTEPDYEIKFEKKGWSNLKGDFDPVTS